VCPHVNVTNVAYSADAGSGGSAFYSIEVKTRRKRADQLFFDIRFDSPVESIAVRRANLNNGTCS
jgi:hypothetical protein